MAAEQAAAGGVEDQAAESRERSTIGFPYGDLSDAVELTKGVHEVGGTTCGLAQLAAHLDMAAAGGGFRQRLLTAKMFGLVTYGRETITLTSLGSRLVDPKTEVSAKAQAFLTVPLYKAVYEQFKVGVLPPTNDGLETAMVAHGVAKKVKDKARQTFQRAAQQAGFFWAGTNRLVMPKGATITTIEEPPKDDTIADEDDQEGQGDKGRRGGGNGGGGGDHRDPLVQGLINQLPAKGANWSTEDRIAWLELARGIFDFVYGKAATITIRAANDSAKENAR